MEQSRDADGTDVWRSSHGELRIWFPAPGVFATRFHGDLASEFSDPIINAQRRAAERGMRIIGFHDWEWMEGYQTASRAKLTQETFRMRANVERIHILVRSKVVGIGVQVANLALGFLTVHPNRLAFEAARQMAVMSRRAPTPP